MPSFDLTPGDLTLIAIIIVMVILPSRLSTIGNFVGRLVRGKAGQPE